ncbi:MAG: NAD(P)-dependent oxidoreductase [Flavobacteriales bacterium]
MKKVLFIDTVHPYLWEELQKEGYSCFEGYDLSEKAIVEQHNDAYGLVIRSRIKINANFLSYFNKLTFIARAGSGMENIDINYAHYKNIHTINAAEGNKQAVAEHALGMILSLFNNLNKADDEVRKGIWKREENRGIELSGKTVGIIGYGNNGSALAKVLSGFDTKVLAYDKYKTNYTPKYAIESDMQTIFEQADILSLHIPLTEETQHLVKDSFLKQLHKPIYLINTSRGACLDTKSLISNLNSGKVLGACLDVLEYEKTSFENLSEKTTELKQLLESDKVILSPHIAGWTQESQLKIAQLLFQKIIGR